MSNDTFEVTITPQTNKLLQAYLAVASDDGVDIVDEINKHIEESLKKFLVKKTLESLRDNHGDVLYSFAKENYGSSIIEEVGDELGFNDRDDNSIASLSHERDEGWSNGITEADIENDLMVEDPEHEAAAEALNVTIENEADMAKALTGEAEKITAIIPAKKPAVNAFEERRKKKVKTNAIVSMGTSPVTDLGGGVTV